ncbi:MAG TPA: carboxypeptidase-like regulatory domain-containing protein [Chthoniobacterales bacterium]|nr:carboxypeptidase-like regulatory domain-containing protein [Chthoniobacterales bacterium]
MKDGAKISSFTTDSEGRFRIALPPGHYMVEKDPVTKIGSWRFEAEVKPGEMTTVRWVGDSGMR